MSRNLALAITGASGAIYAVRLLDVLLDAGLDVHLVISRAGREVLHLELGVEVDQRKLANWGALIETLEA